MTLSIVPQPALAAASVDNSQRRARLGHRHVQVSIEPSREAALAKMKAAIRATVPEYSEAELTARVTLWVDKAIRSGAIVISGGAS
jgi:hypothetical protein